MSDLIEDGIAVEKRYRDKIQKALSSELSDESKVEQISIAGAEYFTEKLRLMFRFYDENRDVQKQLAQEKIDKEVELLEKKKLLIVLTKKELQALKVIAKNKTWATTSLIAKETGHTWLTINRYIERFLDLKMIEIIPTKMVRKRRYKLHIDYSFVDEENGG